MNLFAMKPIWSGLTTVSSVDFNLSASIVENNDLKKNWKSQTSYFPVPNI